MMTKHIVWIHDKGFGMGGCEQYIINTARNLKRRGFKQTFLYPVSSKLASDFIDVFDKCFPIVDLILQLKLISPNLIFVHKISDFKILKELSNQRVNVYRFYHDHKLFCLREHKYKTLTHKVCTDSIGMNCYSCLGFLNRSDSFPGIEIRTLKKLRDEQEVNKLFYGHVVASKYMKRELISNGFNANQIHVIPLYFEGEVSCQREIDSKSSLLFVGQLVRGKGLDLLLKAMTKLDAHVELSVIGEGKQKKEYLDFVKKYGLSDRVRFLGGVCSKQMARYYKESSCVVVPSRTPETFCLVGVEAMSYGLPVIAANVGGISEWLEDNRNGLMVPPNNYLLLAKAINKIIGNKKLRYYFSQESLKIYKNKFLPKYHIDELEGLFLQDS